MPQVSNQEFLQAVFGDEWKAAHVTAFFDDPGNIDTDEARRKCWAGGSAGVKLKRMKPGQNQYFTISLFHLDENGDKRRRKQLFDACFVVVADDVAEKVPVEQAERLPVPSYKLLTSEGSEQWGWILEAAEPSADRVNNLLDGLVAQGLAPDGTDPGMKGVTRYVRLPGGSNTKAKRYVNGEPFKCQMLEWEPDRLFTLEQLAEAFNVDLDAPRNESEGAAAGNDSPIYKEHPIWHHVEVTGRNGDWTLINCPNVANHTDDDPTGAALMVRDDGSIAFKCHHGHCSGESGHAKMTGVKVAELLGVKDAIDVYIQEVARKGGQALAEALGKEVEAVEAEGGEVEIARDDDNFDLLRYIYLPDENKFYDILTTNRITPDALKSQYLRNMPGTRNNPSAPTHFHTNRNADLSIADGVAWLPMSMKKPRRSEIIIDFAGRRLVNSWRGAAVGLGVPGDVSPWLDHAEYLIPDEQERNAVLDYLAFMLQNPAEKPGFTILHRGGQGIGKDLFLKPVVYGLGPGNAGSAKVDQIVNGWGDYVAGRKFLIMEEVDKAQKRSVNNALKTILAPTATGAMTLNIKGKGVITQQDCVVTYMMTNKKNPLTLEKDDRRYLVVNSLVQKREPEYYRRIDLWYAEGGVERVFHYLLNRDISHFNAKVLPFEAAGTAELKDSGRYDYEIMISELVAENKAPFNLGVFTLSTLKNEMKHHDLHVVVSSLVEAVEDNGFVCLRGTKKIDGKVKNTPKFFVSAEVAGAQKLGAAAANFEFFERFKTGG